MPLKASREPSAHASLRPHPHPHSARDAEKAVELCGVVGRQSGIEEMKTDKTDGQQEWHLGLLRTETRPSCTEVARCSSHPGYPPVHAPRRHAPLSCHTARGRLSPTLTLPAEGLNLGRRHALDSRCSTPYTRLFHTLSSPFSFCPASCRPTSTASRRTTSTARSAS